MVLRSNVHQLFPEAVIVDDAHAEFDAVWALWPNKVNKAIARAKYQSILKGCTMRSLDKSSGQFVELSLRATHEQIIAGVKAYVASQLDRNTYRLKDEGRFIPHLATWLGRGGWMDFE